jgi:hypothetical protein
VSFTADNPVIEGGETQDLVGAGAIAPAMRAANRMTTAPFRATPPQRPSFGQGIIFRLISPSRLLQRPAAQWWAPHTTTQSFVGEKL